MSSTFPVSSGAGIANTAATYIGKLVRPDHATGERTAPGLVDAFTAVQADGVACTGRTPATEITKDLLGVPADVNNFDVRLKRQLDAIANELKRMHVGEIQITASAPLVWFDNSGRKRVQAVWLYLHRKGINSNLMSVSGKSDDSKLVADAGVRIKITSMRRGQLSNDRAQCRG
jgi:hypothetical protein